MWPRKWLLLLLCALGFVVVATKAVDVFGFVAPPWLGYWDGARTDGGPYKINNIPRPGGALSRAGVRGTDMFDLREQSLQARVRLLFQNWAGHPNAVRVSRDGAVLPITVIGTNVWGDASAFKLPPQVLDVIAIAFFLGCAVLIALRRSDLREARILALVLLCEVGAAVGPNAIFVPDERLALVSLVAARFFGALASFLLVYLAAGFGARYAWRGAVEWLAYGMRATGVAAAVAIVVGMVTLWFDPLPFELSPDWNWFYAASLAAVVAAAVAAVVTTSPSQRSRAAWLLLPMPIALLAQVTLSRVLGFPSTSWFTFISFQAAASLGLLLGALAVTYALLNRRVLDVGFVLSRTIVVGAVSLVVVTAFVLLEWALGTVLADASHATGVIANAGLALVLGVSLRFIHKRVDDIVERVMFRKRHEDERALRDFSKEAAFVTNPEVLLDKTIENVRAHTDASGAALFLRRNGTYEAVREFGEMPATIDENDNAILALKTWHKPLDPHKYATALRGDVALPLVARGELAGVLLCRERTSGEAYAPDEIDALATFALGVGSAYDALGSRNHDGTILAAIKELRADFDRRLPGPGASNGK
jgi:hypothetical protein